MMEFLCGNHILYFIQYLPLILACVTFKFISSSRPVALKSRAPYVAKANKFSTVVPNVCGSSVYGGGMLRGCAVGRGTVLQVGRSRVPFPVMSLGLFIDLILLVAIWPWVRLIL